MRAFASFVLPLILAPGHALAHTGHIAEVAGHNHWLAGAAIGAAIAIAAWTALKGRRDSDSASETGNEPDGDRDTTEAQES